MPSKKEPRGIKNNNPLNIRIGNTWLGEVPHPTESSFEQFVSMTYGIRAGFIILRRYIRRYRRNTIRKIISSWAPANENATEKYIAFVAKDMKMDPDAPILYEDVITMASLVDAMIMMECGQRINRKDIIDGYKMA